MPPCCRSFRVVNSSQGSPTYESEICISGCGQATTFDWQNVNQPHPIPAKLVLATNLATVATVVLRVSTSQIVKPRSLGFHQAPGGLREKKAQRGETVENSKISRSLLFYLEPLLLCSSLALRG